MVPNREVKTIARKNLLTERRTHFSKSVKKNKSSIIAYYPKYNGGVERHHRVIIDE